MYLLPFDDPIQILQLNEKSESSSKAIDEKNGGIL